jgi:aminomethyltransferase
VSELRRTPLYESHVALGGKIVPFGGWALPVQYTTGIIDEHKTVRQGVGLFDVSHMGELVVRGPPAHAAVQRVVTNDVSLLVDGAAQYTVMCHPSGGIVDDCIVYRRSADDLLIIVNASNVAKDFAWLRAHAGQLADISDQSDDFGLIAVQGPRGAALVARLAGEPLDARVAPFHFVMTTIAGARVMAARTGYTGEDGFEIMVPAASTLAVWQALLEAGAADGVKPIGLGARDTLRLEARLSLYGNDLDDSTTPYEAGLSWVVKGKGYLGEEALAQQKAQGPTRRLVGFRATGRGIPRHDYSILDAAGRVIGRVTSGTTGPTVGVAIGMGYVPSAQATVGASLVVDCRGKPCPVEIVKGPFYKRAQ